MAIRPSILIFSGALLAGAIALAGAAMSDEELAQQLESQARQIIEREGSPPIDVRFTNRFGWPTRHPLLIARGDVAEKERARIARVIAAVPGVGGVAWADGTLIAEQGEVPVSPVHCQDDVQALLRARSIRFEESSAAIDRSSQQLLDEVAQALRPCLGSIIAITGHTDATGPPEVNLELSRRRARAVRQALIERGIPADGLRAQGVGSSQPVEGLAPNDPANRRIEFSVVATQPIQPTPIDQPGAR